jgi:hypothetical protein
MTLTLRGPLTAERVLAFLEDNRAQALRESVTRMLLDGVDAGDVEAFEALHNAQAPQWRAEAHRMIDQMLETASNNKGAPKRLVPMQ